MKKMSNVKFRTIMVPAATLLFATGLIATIRALPKQLSVRKMKKTVRKLLIDVENNI